MEAAAPTGRREDLRGLDDAAVAERVASGRVNVVPVGPSRTVLQILRANTFTYFNALLGAMFVIIVIVGPIQDALFGLVVVINALIGIVQELRAKRTLDRLAILSAPKARIVRNGEVGEYVVDDVVEDDVLEVGSGDQIVVDGVVLWGQGFEVDESLVTGEADPVDKHPDDEVLSGSFVAGGSARYRATRVGDQAFAASLAAEARRFSLSHSELRAGVDTILRLVTIAMIPAAILLVWGQHRADQDWRESVIGSISGLVAMVPEGLVLLTSMAFVVGVIRLGRRQCLVQELQAVETLARVSVVCLDKTGTITDGRIEVDHVEVIDPSTGEPQEVDELPEALVAVAFADPDPNATMGAVVRRARELGAEPPGWTLSDAVAFSSARKWSAMVFGDRGSVFVGAPDVLMASTDAGDRVRERVEELAGTGRRVIMVATSEAPPGRADDEHTLPAELVVVALVVLEEQVRADAPDTIAYFAAQGVEVKVISGDHPATVGAVAAKVGVRGADRPVDARTIPDDAEGLRPVLAERTVFGRVTPHQKRAMVHALQADGHVVAMTGDGVNDVLALKDADMGIAMGSGSAASRAVAQVVLLDSSFASFPHVVAEGRRVIANIERVANLFVTKTVYAVILAFVIGIAGVAYPFLPRHMTLISSLAIGIPGFFFALAPSLQRARPHFTQRVLRFTIPSGTVVAIATCIGYAVARSDHTTPIEEDRTIAVIVLGVSSLFVLGLVARPFTLLRGTVVASMVALSVLAYVIPLSVRFYELDHPPADMASAAVGLGVVAGLVLEVMWRLGVNRLDLSDDDGDDAVLPATPTDAVIEAPA